MKKYIQALVALFDMLLGTALMAAAFGLIIIPHGFASGGVTGFSRIITGFVPIPLSAMVLAVNLLLLLVGLIFVGRQFVAKTVAVSLLFPAALEFFLRYPLTSIQQDPMLSSVAAGALLGVGAGLILRSGASSGGFDIFAVILNKKFDVPVATVLNLCDAFVIILQALGQSLAQTLYGLLVICISAAIVNRVVTLGANQSQITIYSDHHDEIREALLNQVDVGMTSFLAETGFQRKRTRVIVSIVPYQKITAIKHIVMDIDPTAFVVVDDIHSVLGKGYTLDKHFDPPAPV